MYYSDMDVLPIKYITEDDRIRVGKEMTDLATMKRAGFPVPEGLVLLPPEIPIHETLKAFRDHDRERFESSLTIIKRKFFEIEPPQELVEELKKHSISVQTVWKDALQKWIEQIRSLV